MEETRYGSSGRGPLSKDAELAEIRNELKNQGKDIGTLVNKIDTMSAAVTSMTVQMSHLVTKESCAEGRAFLSEDLKNRMDERWDITGSDLSVPKLLRGYLDGKKGQPSPTPTPYHHKGVPPEQKKERGAAFWISLASGIIAITMTFYGLSGVIRGNIERQERTDRILLQLQQSMDTSGHRGIKQVDHAQEKAP